MIQKVWYHIGRIMIWLYMRVAMQVDTQCEHPFPKGAKIIAVNHPSTNDPAYVSTLTGEHARMLILDTLFKVPIFGRSLRWSGHIPVMVGNGKAAMDTAARHLELGGTVMIFPEGKISPATGGLNQGYTGVARLAARTGAPVVPVGIGIDPQYLHRINTRVKGEAEMGTWYLHGPYAMTIGRPIQIEAGQMDPGQSRLATDQIMQEISLLAYSSRTRVQKQRRLRDRLIFPIVFRILLGRPA